MPRRAGSAASAPRAEPPRFEEWAASQGITVEQAEPLDEPEVSNVITIRPTKRTRKKTPAAVAPQLVEDASVLETEGLLLAIAKILREEFPGEDPNVPHKAPTADPVAEALAIADTLSPPTPLARPMHPEGSVAPELRHWLGQVDNTDLEGGASGLRALIGRLIDGTAALGHRRPTLGLRETASDGREIVMDPPRPDPI